MDMTYDQSLPRSDSYFGMRTAQCLYLGSVLFLVWAILWQTTSFPTIALVVLLVIMTSLFYIQTSKIRAFNALFEAGETVGNVLTKSILEPEKSMDLDEKVKYYMGVGRFRKDVVDDQRQLNSNDGHSPNHQQTYQPSAQPFQISDQRYSQNHVNSLPREPNWARNERNAHSNPYAHRRLLVDEIPNNWWFYMGPEKQKEDITDTNPNTNFKVRKREIGALQTPNRDHQFKPFSLPLQPLASVKSSSSYLQQRAKISLNSKMGQIEDETQAKNQQISEEQLRALLIEFKVKTSEFNKWCQHNLTVWLSKSVIPELLFKNIANIRAINNQLSIFGLELDEHHSFITFADRSSQGSDLGPSMVKQVTSRRIGIDQFLRLYDSDFVDFMPRETTDNATLVGYQQNLANFRRLAEERISLDHYLGQRGTVRDKDRIDKLLRLNQLKGDGFPIVYESVSETFSDEELLLNVAIQSIVDNDPYFRKNRVRESLFVPSNFRSVTVGPTDFFINKEPNLLFLLIKDWQVMFPFTIDGVSKLLVFVLHFVKEKHELQMRTAAASSLTDAIKHMDLKR